MKPSALLFALAAAGVAVRAHAQTPALIFDARAAVTPTEPSAAEAALLERVVRREARAAWRGKDVCSEAFTVLGRARGAFTRPDAAQTVALYSYCAMGRQMGREGLAVLDSGRVVAHVVWEGGLDDGLLALPDLNQNGLSEIAIASGGSGQGFMQAGLAVVELGSRGVQKLGMFVTYTNNCGTDEPRLAEHASALFATAGASPRFFSEGFVKPCDAPGPWRAESARAPVAPATDETIYRRLR
jgi:hypothetical protein